MRNAGIVDQNPNWAIRLPHRVDRLIDLRALGYIDRHRHSLATGLANALDRRLGIVCIDVAHCDLCPLLGKEFGRDAPDA